MSTTLVWATVGVLLILAEVFTSTFVLLFFGVAALLVAGLKLTGLESLPFEIVLFGALGILGTLLLRKKIQSSLTGHGTFRADAHVEVDQEIPVGGKASIAYQGSTWTAINEGTKPIPRGGRAAIVRTEGVKLFLKHEE